MSAGSGAGADATGPDAGLHAEGTRPVDPPRPSRAGWLWDHAGRIAGTLLAVAALALMVFLAAIGFKPALFLVVLLATGVVVIAVGGRIHGR